jgi:hypothetical protein
MSERKFITKENLHKLSEYILERYTNKENEIVHVGPNVNTVDVKETNLLYELGQINKRRQEIIELLSKED